MNADAIANLLHIPLKGLTFARPEAFRLLVPVALLLLWWLWQARTLTRSIAPILRALVLVLFVAALADPHSVMRSEGSARPVLIDASASITPQMRDFTVDLLHHQLKLRSGDPALMFASAPVENSIGGALTELTSPNGCPACGPSATNLEAALNQIAGDANARGGPIALVTDGWQNHGDADNAVNALRAAGIQLYIFTPPGAQAIANVAMTQLSLPPALAKAEPFALGVTMMNLNPVPAAGTITIVRNGQTLDQRAVTIAPGQTRYDFPVHTESAGLVNYRATFKPANPALDTYPEDDSLQGWVGIGAQRKVLIVTGSQRDANYLDPLVRRLGLDPTIVVADNGAWNGSPRGYDAVVLNNVSRAHVAPSAQSALVQYVAEGGSLAMVGGDQSFGLGGWQDSPVARVMPVSMKPPRAP